MGVAEIGLGEALLAMVGHCRHEGLVDAGPGRCMGDAEGRWRLGHEKACC